MLISCKNVSFAYDGIIVLKDIAFEVKQGDFLVVVGENGSGKSTLINGILGLKKPETGNINFGENLKQQEIGYLPQLTLAQKDFPANCFEIVLSGFLGNKGLISFYTKAEKTQALENLKKVGMSDYAKKCYREMSGGQQQRVLLARALCATKKLLLLDEPVSGLDPMFTKEFYELICDINKGLGITVIMISHDVKAAIGHSTTVLHLGHKQQLYFGNYKDYVFTDLFKYLVT